MVLILLPRAPWILQQQWGDVNLQRCGGQRSPRICHISAPFQFISFKLPPKHTAPYLICRWCARSPLIHKPPRGYKCSDCPHKVSQRLGRWERTTNSSSIVTRDTHQWHLYPKVALENSPLPLEYQPKLFGETFDTLFWFTGACPITLSRTTITQGRTPHTCTGAPLGTPWGSGEILQGRIRSLEAHTTVLYILQIGYPRGSGASRASWCRRAGALLETHWATQQPLHWFRSAAPQPHHQWLDGTQPHHPPCSDRDTSRLLRTNHWPSTLPVTEKAQHDPHMPWGSLM